MTIFKSFVISAAAAAISVTLAEEYALEDIDIGNINQVLSKADTPPLLADSNIEKILAELSDDVTLTPSDAYSTATIPLDAAYSTAPVAVDDTVADVAVEEPGLDDYAIEELIADVSVAPTVSTGILPLADPDCSGPHGLGEICIGAEGYDHVAWCGCADGLACIGPPGAEGYGVTCAEDDLSVCYWPGEKCKGAEGYDFIHYGSGCCEEGSECTEPAADFGFVCSSVGGSGGGDYSTAAPVSSSAAPLSSIALDDEVPVEAEYEAESTALSSSSSEVPVEVEYGVETTALSSSSSAALDAEYAAAATVLPATEIVADAETYADVAPLY